jgi:hypothetical protein
MELFIHNKISEEQTLWWNLYSVTVSLYTQNCVQNSTANKEPSSKKSIESPKSYSNTKPQQAAPSKSSSNLFR